MHNHLQKIIEKSSALTNELQSLASVLANQQIPQEIDPLCVNISIFVLACIVGYFVVWNVTPALHSPLMAVTNAISSVIVISAIIAASGGYFVHSLAAFFVSINIVGGFYITHRMLLMFQKKKS